MSIILFGTLMIVFFEQNLGQEFDFRKTNWGMSKKEVISSEKLEIGLNEDGDIWRGRYNEDVDLSIRVLKKGLPTLLFINMNQDKEATLTSKGGNTDSIYKEDNNGSGVLKTQSLLEQHPDCVKPEYRYKKTRLHHKIDTKRFEDNGEKLIKSKNFKEHKYNIEYF